MHVNFVKKSFLPWSPKFNTFRKVITYLSPIELIFQINVSFLKGDPAQAWEASGLFCLRNFIWIQTNSVFTEKEVTIKVTLHLTLPYSTLSYLDSFHHVSYFLLLRKVVGRDLENYLDPFKSGFRPGHGPKTTLIVLLKDLWLEQMCPFFLSWSLSGLQDHYSWYTFGP